MANGVMRRLIEIYASNGIDETTAAHFAHQFLAELNAAQPGTVWYVRGANGVEQAFRKGDK